MAGLEQLCWFPLCGTRSTDLATTDLLVDLPMLVAAMTLPFTLEHYGTGGFLVMTLAVTNGWYLYVHHCVGRFQNTTTITTTTTPTEDTALRSTTRFQSLLLAPYVMASFAGAWLVNAPPDFTSWFLTTLIVQRWMVIAWITQVGFYVERVIPLCAYLAFFWGDSILCLLLAGFSNTSRESILFLVGASAIIELGVDLFLPATLQSGSSYLQSDTLAESTLTRFWVLLWSPLLALSALAWTLPMCTATSWWIWVLGVLLLFLVGLLYYGMKELLVGHAEDCSELQQAFLFVVLRLLALMVWTMEACFVVLIQQEDPKYPNDATTTTTESSTVDALLRAFLGKTLVVMALLRGFVNNRQDRLDTSSWWVLLVGANIGWLVSSSSLPMVQCLPITVMLVACLAVVESWTSLMSTHSTTTEALPLLRGEDLGRLRYVRGNSGITN